MLGARQPVGQPLFARHRHALQRLDRGLVFEDEAIEGYFPKKADMDGRDFSLEKELSGILDWVAPGQRGLCRGVRPGLVA